MKINENLKQERILKGLTLEELAKKVGTTKQTIARYENGDIANIPYEKIEAIAKVFGCTPGYLMGWEEEAEPTKENAVTLASIMKDKALLNYIKKIMSLPAKKKEALYKYIDFLSSSDD